MRLDVSVPDAIWERNPWLRSYPIAKRFHKKHGSEWFNKVYYAVYAVYDTLSPQRSGYEGISLSALRKSVKDDYFEGEDYDNFNWVQIKPLGEEYEERALSKEKKQLEKLWRKLVQFQAVVDEFQPETGKEVSTDVKNIKDMLDIWSLYNDIKRVADEDEATSLTGHAGTHTNLINSEF